MELKITVDEFYLLTYQEYWILMLGFWNDTKKKEAETNDKLWMYGDMKAHIANFSTMRRKDGRDWVREDFIKLPGDKEPPKEKLTLKKAKQMLGSKFIINSN